VPTQDERFAGCSPIFSVSSDDEVHVDMFFLLEGISHFDRLSFEQALPAGPSFQAVVAQADSQSLNLSLAC
jgi:hypothetical protein